MVAASHAVATVAAAEKIAVEFADAHAFLDQDADLPLSWLLILRVAPCPIATPNHYTHSRFAPFYITFPLTAAPEQELCSQNLHLDSGYVGLTDLQSFVSYSTASANHRPLAARAAAMAVCST